MAEEGKAGYRDLMVWQKSLLFADAVIACCENIKTPQKHYRLLEQLEAAATSIAMNIAEGKGRFSNKEFVHFLLISRGSLFETMTLLEIFRMRNWISEAVFQDFQLRSDEIGRMLNGLIRSIQGAAINDQHSAVSHEV